MTHAVERGDYFIAISEQTRKDFITTYGVGRERVEVIYPAAESMFVPVTDRDSDAQTVREERHPPQHVPVQGAERGNVQARRRFRLLLQDPVEDREQRRLRLADPRRGDEEDVRTLENTRDRALLGLRERFDPERPDDVEDVGVQPQALHAHRLRGPWD